MLEIDQIFVCGCDVGVNVVFIFYFVFMDCGIFLMMYVRFMWNISVDMFCEVLCDIYYCELFICLLDDMFLMKVIVYLNYCDILVWIVCGMVIVMLVIDNFIKGVFGVVVQNMNFMFDFDELLGLIEQFLFQY